MTAERGTVFQVSSTPWNFTWQSAHIVTEQLVLYGWKVVFLDPIPKRIPRLREFRRVIGRLRNNRVQSGIIRQPELENVVYLLPKALPDRGRIARWINHRVFLPRIAEQVQSSAAKRPHIVYVTLATYAALELLDILQPDFTIYGCYTDVTHDPLAPKDIAQSEAKLVARANVIIVDEGLANRERIAGLQPKCPVIYARTTVPFQFFEPARHLRTLPPSEQPICCYYGDVRSNIDIDLLRKVSFRYRLRLLGSRSVTLDGFAPSTEILPPVSYTNLPKSLADADIFLLPYRRDDPANRAVMPAKTYECLAIGKPTIAIGLPSLKPLSSLIEIADDEAAFMTLIDRAIQEVRSPNAPESIARRAARLNQARENDEHAEFKRRFAEINRLLAAKGWPA